MKILAVCGMGLGSSLMLRMQIEAALKELGVTNFKVEVTDVSTAKGMAADLIVTSPQFVDRLQGGPPVVAIKNYVDKQEMRSKLTEALKL
ncbi:MAG: PTS sugar transporter subunit IIB [Bacillota bacterium]